MFHELCLIRVCVCVCVLEYAHMCIPVLPDKQDYQDPKIWWNPKSKPRRKVQKVIKTKRSEAEFKVRALNQKSGEKINPTNYMENKWENIPASQLEWGHVAYHLKSVGLDSWFTVCQCNGQVYFWTEYM